MKRIPIIAFMLVVAFSCNRKSATPPTGKEVEVLVQDLFDPKNKIPGFETDIDFRFPLRVEKVEVLTINKKRHSRNLYNATCLVKGKTYIYDYPRRYFTDTLQLELKRNDSAWIVNSKKHYFNYITDPADTRDSHF
jgi:hypothetical protein